MNVNARAVLIVGIALSTVAMPSESRATGSEVEYIHTDALGSPVAITNAAGLVIERRQYSPYGDDIALSTMEGPGFTGHVRDLTTGMIYMQQRYYDPEIGRFLSSDPVATRALGDNFNRYWYANNNPYTNTDPDGRECDGRGCWVTPQERAAALTGDWRTYYRLAGSGGDRYAQRAGEVAGNTGATLLNARLSAITNKILSDSIAFNMGANPQAMTNSQRIAVAFKMESIRVDLAKAHVQALEDAGARPDNPVMLDRGVIGDFHERVFENNGADPKAFGGYKTDAAERAANLFGGTTRDIYDYCPAPSCGN
ncbi:TPA: hypothetical protein UOA81_002071 [Stenotrophomonas maltophilia]|nr:hypothetical protein [Stenotrophomonas maltophilia]